MLLVALVASGAARAHLASDSYLRLEIGGDGRVTGQWDIALRDLDVAVGLDADQDGSITWGELRGKRREVEAYAFSRLTITSGGALCRLVPTALMIDNHAGNGYAVLPFAAECPVIGGLRLHYRLLFDIDPTHRGLLTVLDSTGVASAVLSPDHATMTLGGAANSLRAQIVQFLLLGFEHILLGYDHLLFISVLLITAALRRGAAAQWLPLPSLGRVLIETIKTLSAFTLAHALVLTVSVIGLVSVPTRLVEPAVALTIMLAAVDNLWPILPRLRWQVAFLFGLVHGLSFASVLGPMQLPPLWLGLALASFNLGVEAGQIALALLLVPIAFVLREERSYRRIIAPALSVAVFLLAGVWLVDRVFALDLLAYRPASLAVAR